MTMPSSIAAPHRATPTSVAELVDRQGVRSAYQPLVDLYSNETVGYDSSAVALSTFQEAEFFTAPTSARYSRLSQHAALAGALGVGLSEHPAPGVRGVAIEHADPLRGEWDVTVIAPHFAIAFVARELGDSGADMERRFDFATTYDRDLAIAAARALMSRVAAV
jgi:DICT domain-containing protein